MQCKASNVKIFPLTYFVLTNIDQFQRLPLFCGFNHLTPTMTEQTAEEAFTDRSSVQFNSTHFQVKNSTRILLVELLFADEVINADCIRPI